MEMTLNVNGRDHRLSLDPRTTLLDALREHIGLTGSKRGCDQGQRQARQHPVAREVHGAGAALALVAAPLRAGQADVLA